MTKQQKLNLTQKIALSGCDKVEINKKSLGCTACQKYLNETFSLCYPEGGGDRDYITISKHSAKQVLRNYQTDFINSIL